MTARSQHPVTPDGCYFLVRGRLWRCSDPGLTPDRREALVHELMAARRAVREALAARTGLLEARARVDAAKRALASAARCGGRTARPT